MRKLTALILALMVLAGSAAALADTEITVAGTGNILVPADTAVVNIGVNIRNKDVTKAQQHANEIIAPVRKVLTENGIPAEDINTGYVDLYAIYDYSSFEGVETISTYTANSTLAIKVIGGGVTGTMRIVDGIVDNTNTGSAVAPTGTVPTYQEVLAVYDQMVAAKEGSVRFDIDQSLTAAQRQKARNNIGISAELVSGTNYRIVMN